MMRYTTLIVAVLCLLHTTLAFVSLGSAKILSTSRVRVHHLSMGLVNSIKRVVSTSISQKWVMLLHYI